MTLKETLSTVGHINRTSSEFFCRDKGREYSLQVRIKQGEQIVTGKELVHTTSGPEQCHHYVAYIWVPLAEVPDEAKIDTLHRLTPAPIREQADLYEALVQGAEAAPVCPTCQRIL